MSHRMIIRRGAKRHIDEAFRWYADQSPKLGVDFLEAVENTLQRVADNALLYAKLYRDIRRALLPRFPYALFYFVQHERVIVFAVLHTSRDPKTWRIQH